MKVPSIENQITFSGVLLQMVVIFYKAHLNRAANVSSVQKEKKLLSFEANVERQSKILKGADSRGRSILRSDSLRAAHPRDAHALTPFINSTLQVN